MTKVLKYQKIWSRYKKKKKKSDNSTKIWNLWSNMKPKYKNIIKYKKCIK